MIKVIMYMREGCCPVDTKEFAENGYFFRVNGKDENPQEQVRCNT